jgi:hypothetical protein
MFRKKNITTRENDGLWVGEGVPSVPSGSAAFRGEHTVLSSCIGAGESVKGKEGRKGAMEQGQEIRCGRRMMQKD